MCTTVPVGVLHPGHQCWHAANGHLLPVPHFRSSGVLSCWFNGLELSPGFYPGSNEQHKLFQASTQNVLVCMTLVHPVHYGLLRTIRYINPLTHSPHAVRCVHLLQARLPNSHPHFHAASSPPLSAPDQDQYSTAPDYQQAAKAMTTTRQSRSHTASCFLLHGVSKGMQAVKLYTNIS